MYARITRWTVGALALAALVFASAALAAHGPAAKRPPSGGPPGGVWTCDYIAAHPAEASAALVSCDGSIPAGASTTAASSALSPMSGDFLDVPPCKYVPLGGGYVSPGVYAWSDLHYLNTFSYAPETIQWFHWWLEKQNGVATIQGDDNVANSHTNPGGYNYFYWGARNDGYTVQRWNYCWHTP